MSLPSTASPTGKTINGVVVVVAHVKFKKRCEKNFTINFQPQVFWQSCNRIHTIRYDRRV